MSMIVRLAWRNVRRRPAQAALLLLMLCLSTTLVSLGLAINETGREPWNRLHNSVNGFHVQAYAAYHTREQLELPRLPQPDPANAASADDQLAELAAQPGVVAVGGPWPILFAEGRVGGVALPIWVRVLDSQPAAVGRPLVISGRWLDDGDGVVVLEDGLASLLNVAPGDEVTLAGQRLRVRGSAMTTSIRRYPGEFPATIWTNRATAAHLRASGAVPLGAALELRLARPEDAAAFVAARAPTYPDTGSLMAWERARSRANGMEPYTLVLGIIATLLAGLTVATAAVLVTGRMAAQSRQIGALKAIGVTPRQALAVVLVEYLAVATVAGAIGIISGTLLSPLIGRESPILYGAPAAPPITWPRAVTAFAVAMAVVVVGSVHPALRGVRQSTVRALASGARPPRRASRAARFAAIAGIPLPVVLGLRSAMRRPGRTLANAIGLALGVAMVIVGLGASKATRDFLASQAMDEEEAVVRAANAMLIDQAVAILFIGAGLLVALAAVNAMIVAIFAARDAARNHAILRAVGATPRQTVISFVVAQLGAGLLGCAVGIPLGVLLYNSTVTGSAKDLPTMALPALTYVVVGLAVPLLYLMAIIVPAARLARRPAAGALTYE
ncbi:MAG TPA: FtsX-like permease family protein [Candidatus Limnocylindrales bacterium]|nr:FtsX-like permease family protein [Candidatus Limnocylindrales bacterium]